MMRHVQSFYCTLEIKFQLRVENYRKHNVRRIKKEIYSNSRSVTLKELGYSNFSYMYNISTIYCRA